MSHQDTDCEDWLKARTLNSGDSIFKIQSDWTMNSCLNFSSDMAVAYADGFKGLAQLGVETLKGNRMGQDILVYPIVFCFRHHIELQLKQAIKHGFYFLGRKMRTPNVHEIDKLWCELRGILKDVKKVTGQYPDPQEMKIAERIIRELTDIDPDGASFRYAKTRDGSDSLNRDLRILNLRSISETVEKLSFFLDCVGIHLHYLADYKFGAEVEMRRSSYG